MNEEEKVQHMFDTVYGVLGNKCDTEIVMTDHDPTRVERVDVLKGEDLCWSVSKADLLFDYFWRVHN
jgi:hypothetical protein